MTALRPSVFLSYASEDRAAARALRDELVERGLEVWYDENELGGGEAWDQKIRREIRECDYFMPLVSAQTEARLEGYFRREWRLAVERTLDMADDHLFLLPIVLDDTNTGVARVPEKFFAVQWLKVPGGRPTPALQALCRRLAAGNPKEPELPRPAVPRPEKTVDLPKMPSGLPAFPRQEPGQKVAYWAHVLMWCTISGWMLFRRLPKWMQYVAFVWLAIAALQDAHSSRHRDSAEAEAKLEKLKELTKNSSGTLSGAELANMGVQIAKQLADSGTPSTDKPLLLIPFSAPEGDAAADAMASSTFSSVFAQVLKARHGQFGLSADAVSSPELEPALDRGKENHAKYVLDGSVRTKDKVQALTVRIVDVADEEVLWSKAYPVARADAAKIAAEVLAKIPAADD